MLKRNLHLLLTEKAAALITRIHREIPQKGSFSTKFQQMVSNK